MENWRFARSAGRSAKSVGRTTQKERGRENARRKTMTTKRKRREQRTKTLTRQHGCCPSEVNLLGCLMEKEGKGKDIRTCSAEERNAFAH